MIGSILDFLKSKYLSLSLLILLALMIGLAVFTFYFPISFKMTQCTITDSTYIEHNKVYLTKTERIKEGYRVHLTVTDTVHTIKKEDEP